MKFNLLSATFALLILGGCSKEAVGPKEVLYDTFSEWGTSTLPSDWQTIGGGSASPKISFCKADIGKGLTLTLNSSAQKDSIRFLRNIPLAAGEHRVTFQIEADTLKDVVFLHFARRYYQIPNMPYRTYEDKGTNVGIQSFIMYDGKFVNIRHFKQDNRNLYNFTFRITGTTSTMLGFLLKFPSSGSTKYTIDFMRIEKMP